MTQPQPNPSEDQGSPVHIQVQATDAALRASEERYRSLVESLDTSIAMFDYDGKVLFANSIAARTFHLTPETMLGKYMTDLFSPETAAWQLVFLRQVMDTGEGKITESPSRVGDEEFWYRTSVQPVRDASGKVTAALINALDITPSKATETALRASEAKFRGLLETAPAAVIVCDPHGLIRLINAQAEEMFGYSPAELLGETIEVLVPEELRPLHSNLRIEYSRHPRNRHLNSGLQLKAQRKDGSIFPVEIGLGHSKYDNEFVVMCFIVDISEREKAESTLKYQASLLQRVSDAIITLDNELRVTSWNKAATFIYGWMEADVLGQRLPDLLQSVFQNQSLSEVWGIIQSGSIWRGEVLERTKDGSVRSVLSSINQLRDGEKMAGAVVVNRDITERKRREVLQKRISQILEMVVDALPLPSILEQLVLAIEEFQADVKGAVLLADNGQLRHAAAPNLPAAYQASIDGIPIATGKGSCGTAAFEKRTVIVEDIQTSPLWGTRIREIAAEHGLHACWSQPIMDHEEKVLGTFALYYGQPRLPSESELELIHLASHIAGVAIRRVQTELEKQRAQGALQGAHDLLEHRVTERTAELERAKNYIEQKYQEERTMQAYLLALHKVSIELARSEGLDSFYRSIVQLGAKYFGFERIGLVLYDAKEKAAHGTYGMSPGGAFEDQSHLSLPQDRLPRIFTTTMERAERFAFEEHTALYDGMQMLFFGSQATAALWDGELLGWLAVDNAVHHRPLSQAQLDVLSLYAMTVGSLLARKTAEEKARSLTQRLDMATRAGEIGIWEWDLQNQLVNWDERMYVLHGMPPESTMLPINFLQSMVHPDDLGRIQESAVNALTQGKAHIEEYRIKRPNGEIRHIKLNGTMVSGQNNGPARMVGVCWDITDHKRSEDALRQALAAEQELGELKSRFVSMASHEFRTPLAAIMALTETLSIYRRKMDDGQIELRLERIRQQVDHMIGLMDDVLQLARLQAGRMEFSAVLDDVDVLCKDIVEEFDIQSPYHGRIEYVCPEAPVMAYFDARLLRQVVSNLVSNALKYSPPSKIVKLELIRDNVKLFIRVIDEGIGILADDQKYLFEPFHRGRNVGTIPGTGLGLSITKQFVELHGGIINVESTIDVGTTFLVTMPINCLKDGEDGNNTGR